MTTTSNSPTKKRSDRDLISVPAVTRKVSIQSTQGKKVMRRAFPRTSSALFRIDVIMRIIAEEAEVQKVEAVIDTMFKDVETELIQALEARKAELADLGIDDLPEYSNGVQEPVRIESPGSGRFLNLVVKMDQLIGLQDALWLNGEMTNKERNDNAFYWQKTLNGLGAKLVQLESRARAAAREKGKGDEVDEVAPTEGAGEADPSATGSEANAEAGASAEAVVA